MKFWKILIIILILSDLNKVFPQSGTTVIDSIYSSGQYRSYRLYIPAVYSNSVSVPLILNLHGYTSNAYQQQVYSNFMPIADTANFLIAYPQGTVDIYGNPYWNAGTVSTWIVNDTLFLNQLIDSLKAAYNIDTTRIYMTGMSNGGFMSHYMACFCNRKIAAIASVTGSFFSSWPSCNPNRVVPVMQIHGTADPTVPYYGNANMVNVDNVITTWVVNNGCNTTPTFSSVPDINTSDGCTAEHYRYFKSGDNRSIVELLKIINGGHSWPGSNIIIGTTNQDINASVEIWRFFRQFSLSDTWTFIPSMFINHNDMLVYPNPAHDELIIHSELEPIHNIIIKDITGRVVAHYSTPNEKTVRIRLEDINKGVYLIGINNLPLVKKLIVK